MKSFLQHLQEYRSPVKPVKAVSVDTSAEDNRAVDEYHHQQKSRDARAVRDTLNANAFLNRDNQHWITDLALAAGSVPPPDKIRIPGEKAWGSDVGLAFDYNPDSGQVEANQAGFKAVRARHATGAKFPTAYPTRSPAEWREELIDKLNPFN